MRKTRIVLASILKPVDDTRMYEKISWSLSQSNKYAVNIIGFRSKNIPQTIPGIAIHPIFEFPRISIRRLLAPYKCLMLWIKLKPEVVIFNTHELLIVSCIYKILFGGKICYDVLENHYRNILYGSSFPRPVSILLAPYVRLKEYLTAPVIDHFFLAERCYEKELKFTGKKRTVVENKYQDIGHPKRQRTATYHRLIFTGTLASTTGVFRAIELAKQLHGVENKIRLNIVGYCAHRPTMVKLKQIVATYDFITLIGGDQLVPHSEVMDAVMQADMGLICYPKNASTSGAIPTKLYEYLALQLPIIMDRHEVWEQLCAPYDASLSIDYNRFDPTAVWQKIQESEFYTSVPKNEVKWSSEAKKLLSVLKYILP